MTLISNAIASFVVAALILAPFAIAFVAGRRYERRRLEQRFSGDVELELQADGLTSRPPLSEGYGFPLSRRRRR